MSSPPENELSAGARQVIADAHDFGEPTAEDRDRVRTRWLASIAVGGGITSLTGAARAATGTTWGLKSAGLALAFVAGVGGLYAVYRDVSGSDVSGSDVSRSVSRPAVVRHDDGLRTVTPVAPQAPSANDQSKEKLVANRELAGSRERSAGLPTPFEAQPSPATGGVVDLGLSPTLTVPALRTESSAAESSTLANGANGSSAGLNVGGPALVVSPSGHPVATSVVAGPARAEVARAELNAAPLVTPSPISSDAASRLGEELALIAQIRSAVQGGAGSRALELLSTYEQRFDQPVLGMEADALRVDALCRAGQHDAAHARAEAFQASWAASPLLGRVRNACP